MPRIACLIVVSFLLLSSVPVTSAAPQTKYTNAINNDTWRSSSSVFECTLMQSVPFYGETVFRTRAGEKSGFYLKAKSSRFQAGNAALHSQSPVWKTHYEKVDLGSVPVKRGKRPMWLGSDKAELMLAELNRGMEVQFQRPVWYYDDTNPPVNLIMTTVGFRAEYRKYLNCLASLLPANFDQLKRTAIFFDVNVWEEVSARQLRKLDNILQLVKHDPKVRIFVIDGHTDSDGERADNLELSKNRAAFVTQYFKRRGIPDDWVTQRWHGERYPTSNNNSRSGRAKNRRVTIRLERVEEIEVLPLASS